MRKEIITTDEPKNIEERVEYWQKQTEWYKLLANLAFEALFVSEDGRCLFLNNAAIKMFGHTPDEAIGMEATDIFEPESVEKVVSNIANKCQKPYEVMAKRKDGTTFLAEIQGSTVEFDGRELRFSAIRDISERRYYEKNLIEQKLELYETNRMLREKTQFLESINAFVQKLETLCTLEEVAIEVVKVAVEKYEFEHCEVYLLEKDNQTLCRMAGYSKVGNKKGVDLEPFTIKVGHGIVGKVGQLKEPVIVPDTSKEKDYIKENDFCRSELAIPVLAEGELLGVIDAESQDVDFFGQDHLEVLTTIANMSAFRVKNLLAKKAIQESELKHRLIFEKAKDAILLLKDGRFVDCNPVAQEMFGCVQKSELLGVSPIDLSPKVQPDGQTSARKASYYIGLAEQGHPQTFEWEHTRLDGNVFSAEVSLNGFEMHGDRYIQAMVRDVSSRKQMEKALHERTVLFKNLVESTEAVAWEIDVETTRFNYIAPQILSLTGYPQEMWVDTNFCRSVIHPDDREFVSGFCSGKILEGENHSVEYRIVKPDNSIVWVHKSTTMVLEKGEPKLLRGFFLDITQQKVLESVKEEYTEKLKEKVSELEELKEDYQRLFDLNPVSLWDEDLGAVLELLQDKREEVDDLAAYIESNDAFVRQCATRVVVNNVSKVSLDLFGADSIEDLKRHLWETFNDTSLELFRKELIVLANGGAHFSGETQYVRKNGEIFYAYIHFDLLDVSGKAIASIVNVTDLKRVQQELLTAKEKAEESDRLKSEFLNNLSHEIRTPLNGIMGFVNLLSEADVGPQTQKKYLTIIQNSGRQLVQIIDEILEISRLETRQVRLKKTRLCLNELLYELHSIFELAAKDKGLIFNINVPNPGQKMYIYTDQTKLHKVISNLLQNAIKFTPSGLIEFGYTIENNQIVLYVQDTGIGIEKDNLHRVFERFAQENKHVSAEYGGLGLGLSIVKEHLALLGGTIHLSSEKGKGSRFVVTIPFVPAIEENKNEHLQSENILSDTKNNGVVLVVEDDEVSALYLTTVLMKNSLVKEVYRASNGQEAIDLCNNGVYYDLVLMDIGLPVVDGYEAVKEIKRVHPNQIIIAQTAYASEEDIRKIKNAGFDDILAKPINKEAVLRMMSKYLENNIG